MATPRREEKKMRERQARAARAAAARRQRTIKVASFFVVLAIVLVLIATLFSDLGSDSSDKASPTTTTTIPLTPCPLADGSTPRKITFAAGMSDCIDPSKKYTADFDTTEGRIVVELDVTKTPKTVNNFVALARYHYYDNTQIFRTDPSIDIIQGGSPHTQSASDQGPGYNIFDEGDGFKYKEGDLVMARGQGVNSASAQYFFATGPNVSALDSQGTYVTFGHATQGLDVLKKIIGLHTPTGNLGGQPSHTVTVNSVKITES